MPTVNFIEVPLGKVPDTLKYDGDKDHERHKLHEVEPVKYVGRKDGTTFIMDLRRMMQRVHLFKSDLDSIKAGTGWVVAFAPGSNPSAGLLKRVELVLVRVVGCRQYARSVHRGLNGQVDLHLFAPSHDLDDPIVAFRNRHVNLLGRVRAAIDKLTKQENAKIIAEGRAPMLSPEDVQQQRRRNSGKLDFTEIIANIRVEPGDSFHAALQKALEAHGITQWEIDLQMRLVVQRNCGARQKKKRHLKFNIAQHIAWDLQMQHAPGSHELQIKDRETRNTRNCNTPSI